MAGLRFHYNAQGYLARVEESRTGSAGTDYRTILGQDPWGHVAHERAGNGVETYRSFDPAGRLAAIYTVNAGNALIQDLAYTYDTLGNVVKR